MDSTTGVLYAEKDEALAAGVKVESLVSMEGSVEAVIAISEAVKKERRRKNKQARKSRKKNRRK